VSLRDRKCYVLPKSVSYCANYIDGFGFEAFTMPGPAIGSAIIDWRVVFVVRQDPHVCTLYATRPGCCVRATAYDYD
jgi:hypothetical protein